MEIDNNNADHETYHFSNPSQKYLIHLSYRKYFWRILLALGVLIKLVSLYLTQHPQFYRVFHIFQMNDIPKSGPMFLKTFLNNKIPSEYLTHYPLLGLIALISLSILWWLLVCKTTTISVNYKFIEIRKGILNKNIDSVDLVDVRDQPMVTPWYDRILGLGNITIESRDVTSPHLHINGLDYKEAEHFMNFVRENNYRNIVDLRRSKDVQDAKKKKKTNNDAMIDDEDDSNE